MKFYLNFRSQQWQPWKSSVFLIYISSGFFRSDAYTFRFSNIEK